MAETKRTDTPTETRSETPTETRESKIRTARPARAGREQDREQTGPVDLVTGDPASELPMDDGLIVPTPGNPATEPVATAAQSHVPGRVGPRTIPEDATAVTLEPGKDGVDEVLPGAILADTPEGHGRVPVASPLADPVGENLARISADREAGIPLDDQGRRVDERTGAVLPAGRVSR